MSEKLNLYGKIENEFLGKTDIYFQSGLNIVCGDNGSGKTTLLRYICGLKKNKENLFVNAKKVKAKMLSFFFSGDLLGEAEMSIKDNIMYYGGSENTNDLQNRYMELMKRLELVNYENILLKNASEGMRQKMSIIICLLSNAPIKVLDEPFNYIDERSSNELVSYLLEYISSHNDVIIIATNDKRMFYAVDEKRIYYIQL